MTVYPVGVPMSLLEDARLRLGPFLMEACGPHGKYETFQGSAIEWMADLLAHLPEFGPDRLVHLAAGNPLEVDRYAAEAVRAMPFSESAELGLRWLAAVAIIARVRHLLSEAPEDRPDGWIYLGAMARADSSWADRVDSDLTPPTERLVVHLWGNPSERGITAGYRSEHLTGWGASDPHLIEGLRRLDRIGASLPST